MRTLGAVLLASGCAGLAAYLAHSRKRAALVDYITRNSRNHQGY